MKHRPKIRWHERTCHCQECIDAYLHRSHNYGVITREIGDIPGCRPAPIDPTLLSENGLEPASIADYYCDAIRRYTLRFKPDPLLIDKDKLATYLETKNVPTGWKPTTPREGETLCQTYPEHYTASRLGSSTATSEAGKFPSSGTISVITV